MGIAFAILPHSMAGFDPAIQGHALEHLRMLPWMAASEGGHGVVDGTDGPQIHLSPSVMAAEAAIHDKIGRRRGQGVAGSRPSPG